MLTTQDPSPSTDGSVATEQPITSSSFTYSYIMRSGDTSTIDPHNNNRRMVVFACDCGFITDSGFMGNVCSFSSDPCSDGGVYYNDAGSYRSFRREDPLPGQAVSFIDAVIPFGWPVIHPTSGDTYLTAYFTIQPDGKRPYQKGVYVYDRKAAVMRCIADTTASSVSLPSPSGGKWTDFTNNVVVSEAGVFFKGVYEGGQGIYQYANGELVEVVGNPESTTVPNRPDKFTNYRAVTVNNGTVFFVGEWGGSRGVTQGVYACDLTTRILRTVIESGDKVPNGGTFVDFAIEPKVGIFGNSMAANEVGNIVLIAAYRVEKKEYSGVFLLTRLGDDYTPQLIVCSATQNSSLLGRVITDFNTVAINQRSEIAFTVANTDDSVLPCQGLVFYRNEVEGMRSVFKPGDTCISELTHPSPQYTTTKHTGLIAGSQALDSAPIPRVFFRSSYSVDNGSGETHCLVLALATLNPDLSQPK